MLNKVIEVIDPKIRDLDHIERWSIVRKIHKQSVAAHIYFVSRYAVQICRIMGLPIREEFIWAIITHEDDEMHSGDIPQPWKAKHGLHSGPNPILLEIERYVLKVADILESVLFLADEVAMGNMTMLVPFQHLKDRLYKAIGPRGDVREFCQQSIMAHTEYRGRIE